LFGFYRYSSNPNYNGNLESEMLQFSYNYNFDISSIGDFGAYAFHRLALKGIDTTWPDDSAPTFGPGGVFEQNYTVDKWVDDKSYSTEGAETGEFSWHYPHGDGGTSDTDVENLLQGNYMDVSGNAFYCDCENPTTSGGNCPTSTITGQSYNRGINRNNIVGWGCPEGHGSNQGLYTYERDWDPGNVQIRICPVDTDGWCGDGCTDDGATNYNPDATLDCIGIPLDECTETENCNLDCCEYGA
jgi:hypothetical protein